MDTWLCWAYFIVGLFFLSASLLVCLLRCCIDAVDFRFTYAHTVTCIRLVLTGFSRISDRLASSFIAGVVMGGGFGKGRLINVGVRALLP